jgi:hypothetical protein
MCEPLLLPTVPDKAAGVVDVDPLTLQCHDCRSTVTHTNLGLRPGADAALVILSGYHFHRCEGTGAVRRCPTCLDRVRAACDKPTCHQ